MPKKHKTSITAEPARQELFITREFDAPRELVFKAHVDPNLLPQWMGPRKYTMRVVQHEAKDGGRWRFLHTDPSAEHGFHGVFHEVLAPERIIRTFEYEGLPEKGHVTLETLRLEALPGDRTKLAALLESQKRKP